MNKIVSLLLTMCLLLTISIPAFAEETSDFEDLPLKDSYIAVCEELCDKGIDSILSYDNYLTGYQEGLYENMQEYEDYVINMLSNTQSETQAVKETTENSESELVSSNAPNESMDPQKAPVSDDARTSDDSENDKAILKEIVGMLSSKRTNLSATQEQVLSRWEKSYNDRRDSFIFPTYSLNDYIKEYIFSTYSTLKEYEQKISNTRFSSLPIQYFNGTGEKLPDEAVFNNNHSLLSHVQKGDIMYEEGAVGHAAIVEGRFYDTHQSRFYIRVIEAVTKGVLRGIIDDGRIETMGVRVFSVNGASSAQKDAAVQFCVSQLGKDYNFDLFPHYNAEATTWYCSELVWAAYYRQGISLCAVPAYPYTDYAIFPYSLVDNNKVTERMITSDYRAETYLYDLPTTAQSDGYKWARAPIIQLFNDGIMSSYSRYFSPRNKATRGDAVCAIYKMVGGDPYVQYNPFSDVYGGEVRDAVAWGYQKNVVSGVTPSSFSPSGTVTREQMVTFLYRFAGVFGGGNKIDRTYQYSALDQFTDKNQVSSYATAAMKWAVSKGIMNGRTTTQLAPKDPVTRGEMAAFIARMVTKLFPGP